MKKILSVKYSVDRKEEYQIKTVIYEDIDGKFVRKEPYTYNAKKHIVNMHMNYLLLQKTGMNIVESILREDKIDFPYIEGQNFAQVLLSNLEDKDVQTFKKNLLKYKNLLTAEKLIPFTLTEEFCATFGEQINISTCKSHIVSNIDLNFENIIVNYIGEFYIIDYEWVFQFPIPLDYVIFRAVTQFFDSYHSKIGKLISIEEVYTILDIDLNNLPIYESMEKSFSNKVVNGWVKQRAPYYKPNFTKYDVIDQYIKNFKDKVNHLQYFWSNTNQFNENDTKFIAMTGNNEKYQITLPDEKISELRIDPGNQPLIYFQMKQIAEVPMLSDMLERYEGLYLISKENGVLEFITLSNDPQLVFKFNNFKKLNLEIVLKKEINFVVNILVGKLLSSKEQLELQNIETINMLQKDLMICGNTIKENERIIEIKQLEFEQQLKYIEELKAENLRLAKINQDILTSKRWKILSAFSKNG